MKLLDRIRGREQRASYTDQRLGVVSAAAASASAGNAESSLALEIASGLWGRALAMAAVLDGGIAGNALTAGVMALVGRELCRRGEVVLVIGVEAGAVTLTPACDWLVGGGPSRGTWSYQASLSGPSGITTVTVPAAQVVHLQYASSPQEPWVGMSPLQFASDGARLAGLLDRKLGDEVGLPVGGIIPMPDVAGDDDDDVDPNAQLREDIGGLKGQIAFPATTASGHGEGRVGAPQTDYRVLRVGAMVPAELVALQAQTASMVLSACGVSPALAHQSTDAASRREALRAFLHTTVGPLGRLILPELRDKLDAPTMRLNFDQLFAADVRTRAQAMGAMVAAGLETTAAAEIAGIFDDVQ